MSFSLSRQTNFVKKVTSCTYARCLRQVCQNMYLMKLDKSMFLGIYAGKAFKIMMP